jgi:uncharacterized membrane protein YccC
MNFVACFLIGCLIGLVGAMVLFGITTEPRK